MKGGLPLSYMNLPVELDNSDPTNATCECILLLEQGLIKATAKSWRVNANIRTVRCPLTEARNPERILFISAKYPPHRQCLRNSLIRRTKFLCRCKYPPLGRTDGNMGCLCMCAGGSPEGYPCRFIYTEDLCIVRRRGILFVCQSRRRSRDRGAALKFFII